MKQLLLFIATFFLLLGCGDQQTVSTAVQQPKLSRVEASFAHEDFSNLPNVAPSVLQALDKLSDDERGKLFRQIAKGGVDELENNLSKNGLLFFKAVRYIEGNHDNFPTYERLNEIYSYWKTSGGDFLQFHAKWSQPVIEGFQMRWVKDLPDRMVNGRLEKGWIIKNTGTTPWPKSLELEPLMTNPRGALVTKFLPDAIKVLSANGEAVRPGETVSVYVDVTDVRFATKTDIGLYFISTYEEKKGRRSNIHPRPETALGKVPNLLFVSFDLDFTTASFYLNGATFLYKKSATT